MTQEKNFEKPKYKDVKLSTLLKKIEQYIKSQQVESDLPRGFYTEIRQHINDYLSEHHYPIRCDTDSYFYQGSDYQLQSIEIEAIADEMKKNDRDAAFDIRKCAILAELTIRKNRDRKNKTLSFKSIVKSGPSYEMKVSELIERRKQGFSYEGDSVAREIQQVGFDSAERMLATYEMAKKMEEKLRWIKYRYENLSEKEKMLRKQNLN